MHKKGMTSTIFNWIFVVIAGAIIMLFFFKIITFQSQITEKELSMRLVRDMDEILTSKSTSTETSSEILLPDAEFIFSCSEPCHEKMGCLSWMETGSTQVPMSTQPIFTISNVKADKIFAFTTGWNVPFHAANFLFIAVPGEKIIFPTDCDANDMCRRLFLKIPQRVRNSGIVVTSGGTGDFVRYVTFESCGNNPNEVCIKPADNQIIFLNNGVSSGTYNYYGDEMALGAIFSQDGSSFECNSKKAFYKLKNVAGVLQKKSSTFLDYYTTVQSDQNCQGLFTQVLPLLLPFITNYEDMDAAQMKTAKTALVENNEQLRRKTCSTVY